MYCSWIGKICIFVTMINSQDKILQKTERMIYFHIMFMSASSIKRKSTLLLREVARRFIFKSATTFPGRKQWTREPDDYTLTDDKIEIITQPGIDLWQRTYYHFRNDNAPVLQIETEERFFSFIVKTDFILDDDRRKMQSFLKKHFMRKKSGPTDVWTAGK